MSEMSVFLVTLHFKMMHFVEAWNAIVFPKILSIPIFFLYFMEQICSF